jgi:excisionase family DNA binding protein
MAMKLTIKQAAVAADVSESLVYQWCQERRLPHYRFGGSGKRGRILIDDEELKTFLASCRVPAGEQAPPAGTLRHIRA